MREPPRDGGKEKLEPDFLLMLAKLEKLLATAGLRATLFEGYRSSERQSWLYAQGRDVPGKILTSTPPGRSIHEYGRAADYAFKDDKGKWTWEGDWQAFGRCAAAAGLEWGGNWRMRDYCHVQHTNGLSWRDLQEGKRPVPQLERLGGEGKQVKVIVDGNLICTARVYEGGLLGPIEKIVASLGLTLYDHVEDQGKVYIYTGRAGGPKEGI